MEGFIKKNIFQLIEGLTLTEDICCVRAAATTLEKCEKSLVDTHKPASFPAVVVDP